MKMSKSKGTRQTAGAPARRDALLHAPQSSRTDTIRGNFTRSPHPRTPPPCEVKLGNALPYRTARTISTTGISPSAKGGMEAGTDGVDDLAAEADGLVETAGCSP